MVLSEAGLWEAILASFVMETDTVSAGEEGRVAILCNSKTLGKRAIF